MKLTEAKLKKLIIEVITEMDDYYDPQFKPPSKERDSIAKARSRQASVNDESEKTEELEKIQTVGDFFKELDDFENNFRSKTAIKRGIEFFLAFFGPAGEGTHFADAAEGLAELMSATNKRGRSLYKYEGKFPLLAFLDLDPKIEEIIAPGLISKWISQLETQLKEMNLNDNSPMPNADDLFLNWMGVAYGEIFSEALKKIIPEASEEYERQRIEWNEKQRQDLEKTVMDPFEKLSGYKRLAKLASKQAADGAAAGVNVSGLDRNIQGLYEDKN